MFASSRHRLNPRIVYFVVALAMFAVLLDQVGFSKSKPKEPKDKVELGVVIKAIEDSLKEAAQRPIEGFPKLNSVTISAATTVSKEAGGGIKIFIINIGGTRSTENASAMSFELKPPPEVPNKLKPFDVRPEDIKDALARQIAQAKIGFLDAKNQAALLKTDKIEIQIGFKVTNSGSAGIDTGSLLPVGITADGKLSKETANTITLDFGGE